MNSKDPKKRVWPTVVLIVLGCAALLTCLVLSGILYLPELASRHLPVEQIQRLGFADFSGRVTRIGLRQAAAGPFLFGRADQPAVSIGSVEMDYTPAGLRSKTIDCLRIDDLTIHALLGADGIILPGLAQGGPDEKAPAGLPASPSLPAKLDGTIRKIEIRSARVILKWRDAAYRIPFEADIQSEKAGLAKLTAHLRLLPGDQRLSVTARLDQENNGGDLTLDGANIHLDRFAHLFHHVSGLDCTGMLDLAARAKLQIKPLALSDAEFKADWHSGRLTRESLVIAPTARDESVRLTAVSRDLANWQVDVQGLQVQAPVPVTVSTAKAAIDLAASGPSITGQAGLAVRPFAIRCPRSLSLEDELGLSLAFDVRQRMDEGWSAVCHTVQSDKAGSSDRLHLTAGALNLKCGAPHLRMEGHMDEQGVQARWEAAVQTAAVKASGLAANLPHIRGKGRMTIKVPYTEAEGSGDARFEIPDIAVAGRGLSGRLKNLVLSADWQQKDGQAPRVRGRLHMSDGRASHDANGLMLSGMRLDLPYDSDAEAGSGRGTFFAKLGYRRHDLGQLQGRVTQKGGGFRLAASHSCPLFPGMAANISGRVQPAGAGFPEVALQFDMPAYDLPAGDDLGRLIPGLDGMALSGTVSARAKASISDSGFGGTADLMLKNGRFEIAEKKLSVEGIDAALHFPEMPRVRSGPAQPLRFSRAALGGIVIDGGRFDIQVESPTTLFVEKGRLDWCGGKVDAQSLRVTAGKQEYAVSLYCQRLELSRILEQLGAVNAKGTGTVNGRIPITYSSKRIHFDDGFLFSTPGETGQIQLTGTEILTRGIPMGTPQFAQVDLAREALKDYAYKWAKLGMTTEGESLVMRLQFDGQPAGPLPFVYKKEIGSFVRIEAGAQGSNFQGISLDVNLKLPLDRLLEYKEIVDMIE